MARTLAQTSFLTFHVPSLEGRTFRTQQEAEKWRSEATPDEVVEIENFVILQLEDEMGPHQNCHVTGKQAEVALWKRDTLRPAEKIPRMVLSRDGMVALRDILTEAILAYHTPTEETDSEAAKIGASPS
jgi:hypothetical protein